MEFKELMRVRKSIRRFKADAVPQEKLDRIMEAARVAPSWANKQCWRFVLVDDAFTRRQLSQTLGKNPSVRAVENAPYVLVVCGIPAESGNHDGKSYFLSDCGIAMAHIMLAAADEGLGSCFVGGVDEKAVKDILHIPSEVSVVCVTPLGYPDEEPQARSRKSLGELLHKNVW